MLKFIFVTGGVVSGLGKGISSASIGAILKNSKKKVFIQKCDPYLNIDPGTISPFQHGEVYVTNDGAETDLDLGHYERFIGNDLSKLSNITAGKIYKEILQKERNGDYIGQTIQVIPHVTNLIKDYIYKAGKENQADILIIEIGGTVGDIESLPFIEAIRQIRIEQGKDNVLFAHVGLLPYIEASKEYKTKPIQHSVKDLLSLGIQPDIIIARSKSNILDETLKKLALFCNVDYKNVINAYDAKSIYEVPRNFYNKNIHKIIGKHLKLNLDKIKINEWEIFINKIKKSKEEIEVSIIGKYISMPDAYLSIIESLNIAGYENNVKIKINWILSDTINENNYIEKLKYSKGIIIPGGFGERGIEGKILTAKYAREKNIPFLGICLGMQVACIEFARSVLNIENANSEEFTKSKENNIFKILPGKKAQENLGGTLRLGQYKTFILKGSLLHKLYKKNTLFERHRHRYEFNNEYKKKFENKGFVFSGIYKEQNLVEVIENPKNDFFIGSQFHPEFTSRPNKPNPLFDGLVKAIINSGN